MREFIREQWQWCGYVWFAVAVVFFGARARARDVRCVCVRVPLHTAHSHDEEENTRPPLLRFCVNNPNTTANIISISIYTVL